MKKIKDILKGTGGFSLLEVLMAVTVIVIIMAIVSPDIASTGHKAKLRADTVSAACIGRALELYIAEQNLGDAANFTAKQLSDILVAEGYLTGISKPKSGGEWSAQYAEKKVTVKVGEKTFYPDITEKTGEIKDGNAE